MTVEPAPDPTTDPALETWVDVGADSPVPIQNLPFGVFTRPGEPARVGVAIGDFVLDLYRLAGSLPHAGVHPTILAADSLHPLLEAGPDRWRALRRRISTLLEVSNPELRDDQGLVEQALIPRATVEMLAPELDHMRFLTWGHSCVA